jgi:hypothetical protein
MIYHGIIAPPSVTYIHAAARHHMHVALVLLVCILPCTVHMHQLIDHAACKQSGG